MEKDWTELDAALTRDFLLELAVHNPIGLFLTPDDVGAWCESIWPRFKRRGYVHIHRALASWWSRVSENEVAEAVHRRERFLREKEEAELAELAKSLESTDRRPAPRRFTATSIRRG